MRITDGLAALRVAPEPAGSAVVSIGVFDGVHLGHQAILAANLVRARTLDAVPTVVTFRSHPKELLLGHAPLTLTSIDHRLELFAEAGIQHCLVLDFTAELRSYDAEDFTSKVLLEGLGARAFVLGFDSKFGRDRSGTPEHLRSIGLDVEVVEAVQTGGRAVSSTAIREAISLGDLAGASAMLGRPVTLHGRVVHGDKRGRQLGFPTANLDLDHELPPPEGVWACRARLLDSSPQRVIRAVTNVGHRPTVAGDPSAGASPVVEAHLLDYEGDLYDQRVGLEFVRFLRPEQRFASLDELKAAIGADIARARETLGD